ncbi:MAG: HAD-IB family phosphatase [Planctomycetes bacterium]|nr:HAD-IB family phosphatase [Planctomycetota bacterium]
MTALVRDEPPPYHAVVFDCDSTLSSIEGIDELARAVASHAEADAVAPSACTDTPAHASRRPPGQTPEQVRGTELAHAIAELTRQAMAGELALEAVYARRLELLRPSRAAIAEVGRRYVETAVPQAHELLDALRALGKRVVIVSGGIRQAVDLLARSLGFAPRDVFAVDVRHDAAGAYVGFDERSPLATHAGKAVVIARLAAECDRRGLAVVGDGITDLEGAHAARRFVAFGGVVRRESVFARARAATRAPTFAALLDWLCSAEEIAALRASGAHTKLLDVRDRLVGGRREGDDA